MVAETVSLPNIRKMFIPDEGYTILDCDLEKADAQVVAWEAGDEDLKQMFREHANIHAENAKLIFGLSHVEKSSDSTSPYQRAKQGVHLTNYGGRARKLAEVLGATIHEAELFQRRWFSAHPKILGWHRRTMQDLRQFRKVRNKFGFERYYFDRIDSVFTEALAWTPQSTVSIVTNKGLLNIHRNIRCAQILIQVHDSLVLQVPTERTPDIYKSVLDDMTIPIPYDDPLTIPVNLAASTKSWGDVERVEL